VQVQVNNIIINSNLVKVDICGYLIARSWRPTKFEQSVCYAYAYAI